MSNIFLTKKLTNILKTTLRLIRLKSSKPNELKGSIILKRLTTSSTKMQRYWKSVDVINPECPPQTGVALENLRLMSYNILAQDLLMRHMDLYQNQDWNLLKWPERVQRLRAEIQAINPDILCLQEMQFNHLHEFVRAIRGGRKLEYVYKKKTSDCTDGCAIIYDKEKVSLVGHDAVEYLTVGDKTLNRDNVAIMAKFRLKHEPAKLFIVATTHLLYNPRREDVRLAQVGKLLEALALYSKVKNHKTQHLPIILTGDFNFQPHSPPFDLLNQPLLKSAEELNEKTDSISEWRREQRQQMLQMHTINFGDGCASTFQSRWIIVDYILFSYGMGGKPSLTIRKIYKLPTIDVCYQTGQIPNSHLGSDHYSLAIDFSIT